MDNYALCAGCYVIARYEVVFVLPAIILEVEIWIVMYNFIANTVSLDKRISKLLNRTRERGRPGEQVRIGRT